MKVFGLTGGIGMGKSTAARCFSDLGVRVVDTDDLARELVEPGQPALAEIKAAFGGRVIDDDGHLQRSALAKIVFADSEARRRLEEILHPRIRGLWQARIHTWRDEGVSNACVVIPLLFETKAEVDLDVIVCVGCNPTTQKLRLAMRGWSEAEIQGRLASQLPIADKITQSHHVLWNEGPVEVLAAQVARLMGK
jgi:dephospho-CoA kinase